MPEQKIDSNESTERQIFLKRITHSIKRRLNFSSLFFGHRLKSDHIGVKLLPTDSNELTERQNAQKPKKPRESPELERVTSRQASAKDIRIIEDLIKSKELNQLELQEPAEQRSSRIGFAKEKRCQMKLQQRRDPEPLNSTPVEQALIRVLELKTM